VAKLASAMLDHIKVNSHGLRRSTLVAGLVVGLALAAAVPLLAADGGRAKLSFNRADQAAARSVVIRAGDLDPAGGSWLGGPIKPNLVPLKCADYHPRQSDLVVTGAAASRYSSTQTGVTFASQATVLRSARMVRLDWKRSAPGSRGLAACLRRSITAQLGSHGRLVSSGWVAVPGLASCAAGFRAVVEIEASGQSVRALTEQLTVCRGRTEIAVSVFAAASAQASVRAQALRLARALVARATA
jgi:hypothetical protein